ncbi:MAG: DUF4827 domain-containing protein [Tannerella sp.]|jgi:hypothetical protein|nr:DUF4827 domain-containing protein [Tannerella sp.]
MKSKIGVLMVILGVFLSACSGPKSFKEYKKEETDAINALIEKEGFEIINSYPSNGVFRENQFVLLDNQCYLNVIDSGNGNRAVSGKTIVLMRCSYVGISKVDSSKYSIFPNGYQPIEFIYGNVNEAKYQASQSGQGSDAYLFLSPGIESALNYVGENAIVRMIIPFNNGQESNYPLGIGSAFQDNNMIPMYFDRIRFAFDDF